MGMVFTHNDIDIGSKVKIRDNDWTYTVTDVLDGYNGIGLTRTGDIHSKDRFFRDIIAIVEIKR